MYVSQLLASYDYSEVSPQNATRTSLRFSALKKIYMRPLVNLLVTVTVPTCIDLPFITQVCLSLDLKKKNMLQEYVKGISSTGMQSSYGFDGQVNACWTHKMTRTEIELIRSAGFLVSVIHGRLCSLSYFRGIHDFCQIINLILFLLPIHCILNFYYAGE
jgi:hypothetical protein